MSITQIDYATQLKNVPTLPSYLAVDHDFAAQKPTGNLTANITNTITLSPVPKGINATNTGHYLWIVDVNNGTAEAVLITGGTAVSGASTGTLTFVPTHNYTSKNYTIASASNGLQEAIWRASFNTSGIVNISAQVFVKAPISFPALSGYSSVTLQGPGKGSAMVIRAQGYTGHIFFVDNSGSQRLSVTFRDFTIHDGGPAFGAWVPHTGIAIYLKGPSAVPNQVINVGILNPYTGIQIENIGDVTICGVDIQWNGSYLIATTGGTVPRAGILTSGAEVTQIFISDVNIAGDISVAFANRAQHGVLIFTSDGVFLTDVQVIQVNWAFRAYASNAFSGAVLAGIHLANCQADYIGVSCFDLSQDVTPITSVVSEIFINGGHWGGNNDPGTDGNLGPVINLNSALLLTFCIKGATVFGGTAGIYVNGCSSLIAGIISGNLIYENGIIGGGNAGIVTFGVLTGSLVITGNSMFNYAPGNQAYGFWNQSTGTYHVVLVGNDLSGNVSAPLRLDTIPPHFTCVNNIGIDDLIATVPSALSVALPFYPTIYLTGTTTINTMTGGWSGRTVRFIKTDAGTLLVGGGGNTPGQRSLAQNFSITMTYDGANWY